LCVKVFLPIFLASLNFAPLSVNCLLLSPDLALSRLVNLFCAAFLSALVSVEYSSLPFLVSSLVDVKTFLPSFLAFENCSPKVGINFFLIFPIKDLTLPGFFSPVTPPPLFYPLGDTCLLYNLFATNLSSFFHITHFVSYFSWKF
jgi:hypothetical protein